MGGRPCGLSGTLHLQHNDKTLPFLMGPDLKALDPLRIAAVPGAILDVVVREALVEESPFGALAVKRNPVYGLEEVAMDNYSHIDRPNTSAPGPQFLLDDTTIQPENAIKEEDEEGGDDILEKIERLKDLAEKGSIDAQMELATIYANGQGVPQNYSEAGVWYFEAVKAGHIGARVKMGWLYENGLGVKQNYQMALKFS
ncbi:hypothetical protein BGW39_007022 [Mortierella sp. 14UC]|nr:hypothetical protein BGW39_007022 [Mortierella sp. 14UC]